MSTDYNKLFFDRIEFEILRDEIALTPHFICPKCRKYVKGKISKDSPMHSLSYKVPISSHVSTFDFNKKVTFKMPCCGTEITLYIAIHYELKRVPTFCISIKPIPKDWYRTE